MQVMELSNISNSMAYLTTAYEVAKDWQTLIAGILALSGGWATLVAARAQSLTTEKIDKERRAAEAYSARAIMPLALSEMASYASRCIDILQQADDAATTAAKRLKIRSLPLPPNNLLDSFKQAIKLSDDPIRKHLADIIAWFQVHEARLLHLRETGAGASSLSFGIPQAIIDAADLQAKSENLFKWARREEEGDIPRATAQQLRSAIRVSAPTYEPVGEVLRLIELRERLDAVP